jgi:predicted DNA binding CopG/RHH family protein
MTKQYLDNEEKDLEKALDKINVAKLSKPNQKTQNKFKSAASNFVKKEIKTNIKFDPLELEEIKKRADFKGLEYQSLIKYILHKYITGQLVEKG